VAGARFRLVRGGGRDGGIRRPSKVNSVVSRSAKLFSFLRVAAVGGREGGRAGARGRGAASLSEGFISAGV
jgi:hypothetical protein